MDLPKIVVDEKGYLRVQFSSGEMLPETDLIIRNQVDMEKGNKKMCEVTVTFMAEHSFKK